MKKISILISLILSIFIVSCSTETVQKVPQDVIASKTLSFDNGEIKSVMTSNIILNTQIATRNTTSDAANTTLLVYSDENENIKPMVFSNEEKKYIIFSVDKSYPLNDYTFAIDFNNIYISAIKPTFNNTANDSFVPTIDLDKDVTIYDFQGQMIVNTQTQKAYLLSDIDFNSFNSYENGHFIYTPNRSYKFDKSFVMNNTLYIPASVVGCKYDVIYSISLSDPTVAKPMSNGNFFNPSNVLTANSKAIMVEGNSNGKDGVYLLDLNEKHGPVLAKSKIDGKRMKLDNGFGYECIGFDNFKDTLLLDDHIWNIKLVNEVQQYYKNAAGENLKYDIANGFYLGDKWYGPDEIKSITINAITLINGDVILINEDENGYICLETYHNGVLKDLDKNNVKDFKFEMKTNGFKVHNEPMPLEWIKLLTDFKYESMKGNWSIYRDEIGRVYQIDDMFFIQDKTGKNVYRLNTSETLYLEGDSEKPITVQDYSVLIDGSRYRITQTAMGNYYIYYKSRNCYLLTPNNDYFIDGRVLLNDVYMGDTLIEGITWHDSYTAFTDKDGKYYTVTSDDGYFTVHERAYFLNKEKQRIQSVRKQVENGLFDNNGEPVQYTALDNSHVEINGISLKWYVDSEGNIGIPVHVGNIFVAEKYDTRENMELYVEQYAGTTLAEKYLGGNYQLLNITRNMDNSREYNFYYYCPDYNNVVYITLNTQTATLEISKIFNIGECRIPHYSYSDLNNNCWTANIKNMVWNGLGNILYWIDDDLYLNKIEMESGSVDRVSLASSSIASKDLSRIGNHLVFSGYKSNTEVGTYMLNCNDIHSKPKLAYSNKMDVVPLVEITL